MRKNVSGQFLYFKLISITSGSVITGASGSISGTKSLDGLSGCIVLSGNIIELGNGSYRANLYDFDTNGDYVGYEFQASNAVAVQFSMVTQGGLSGTFNPGSGFSAVATLYSGQLTVPYSGQMSGQLVTAASGVFASVPISTLSGVVANSGLNVEANVVRWLTKAPRALVASGHVDAFPAINAGTVRSGTANTVQLLTTAGEGTSGILDGCVITIVEGLAKGQSRVIRNWGSSGIALIDPPWDVVPGGSTEFYIVTPTTRTASGTQFPSLPKAALSGVVANSGLFVTATATVESGIFVTVPKETLSGVVANSGLFVNATVTVESGLSVIATLYSGSLNSGQTVAIFSGQSVMASPHSGQLSGQYVVAHTVLDKSGYFAGGVLSGVVYPASGASVLSVPYSGVLSGQYVVAHTVLDKSDYRVASGDLNSGQTVAFFSGQSVMASPHSGMLSGQPVTPASGAFVTASLNSGQSVLVYSGQLSGQGVVTLLNSDKSGYTVGVNLDKSGYFAGGALSGVIFPASGVSVVSVPYSGMLSGQYVGAFSGAHAVASLLSGQTVLPASGQLSGQCVVAHTVSDKSGYTLAAAGLDQITVESGVNMRQAQALTVAGVAGALSGAGTATVTISTAGGSGAINRITASVSASGNRTTVTVNPPA